MEQEIGVGNQPKITGRDIFWALLSYLGALVILPFSLKVRSPFIVHHLRQGMALFIIEIILTFIFLIPIAGVLIGLIGWLLCMLLSFFGFVRALSKKYWEAPLLSRLAKKVRIISS
jgi:uncharacterized membrane protein